MNFSDERLNEIIQSMYLDVPPSELTLDWFKAKLDAAILENKELLNSPIRKQEYEILKAIINSNEFKVLEDKTQVINRTICGVDVSTRLTHTIQVFWISFRVAEALGLDPLKAGIIALSHDLGHVGFGHSGEREIDRIVQLIKNRTSLIMLNIRDYDFKFYDNLDKFTHEAFSVIKFEKILKDNDVKIDQTLFKEIVNGILMHGGKFGKASTMEGKIVSVADKIYLHQDVIDMYMLHQIIRQNIYKDIKLGYKISPEVNNGAKLLIDILDDIPAGLGNTPEKRRDNMLKSLLLNSDKDTFAFDQQTLKEIEMLKSYLYENLYSLKYIKEIENKMNNFIFFMYNGIMEQAEEAKEDLEDLFRTCGYFKGIDNQRINYKKLYAHNLDMDKRSDQRKFRQRYDEIHNYIKTRENKRFRNLMFCFLHSDGGFFKRKENKHIDIETRQRIECMKKNYGDYLEPDKVFNLILGLTDTQIINSQPFILLLLRYDADENPLIDRNILEKNKGKNDFCDTTFYTRQYFDACIDDELSIPVDQLPRLGSDLRGF